MHRHGSFPNYQNLRPANETPGRLHRGNITGKPRENHYIVRETALSNLRDRERLPEKNSASLTPDILLYSLGCSMLTENPMPDAHELFKKAKRCAILIKEARF
jgi:hypothetical protein